VTIINCDQQGFIQNRFIGCNIRQINDVIDFIEGTKGSGLILFLDFKKAFDTVEWNFMFNVLAKFGFKNDFITWIKILYNDISSSVNNNGWKSPFFKVTRGLKQGCPISSLLFIVVAEILATKLRNNTDINGITIKTSPTQNKKIVISQLADDTTLFLHNTDEIPIVLDVLHTFGIYSGLKLNKSKTEGLLLGTLKHTLPTTTHSIKFHSYAHALGIYFGTNQSEIEKLNWENKINKCRDILNVWNRRNLTFYGKLTIIKSLLLPKLSYVIQSIPTPKHVLSTLNTMIFQFLWSNKREKIKRSILIGPKQTGGLEVPDIYAYNKSLKMKWVKELLISDNSSWKIIPSYILNQFGAHLLVFQMNLDSYKSLPKPKITLFPFYREVLEHFIEYKNITDNNIKPNTFYQIRKQILWGNKYIKYAGKPLLFTHWIDSNILYIEHILNNQGKIDETLILQKLKTKTNWASEVFKIKQAVPNHWKQKITSHESTHTNVRITYNNHYINTLKHTQNKNIRNTFIHKSYELPYIHRYWQNLFNCDIDWKALYTFINTTLVDNRIKQLRFKVIHRIIATNENLFRWNLVNSPLCLHCGELETLDHFLLHCRYLDQTWNTLTDIFKHLNVHQNIRCIKHVAIGYKISYNAYDDINIIISYIVFSIYKAYFMSERRQKQLNILKLIYNELIALDNYHKHKKIHHTLIKKFMNQLQTSIL